MPSFPAGPWARAAFWFENTEREWSSDLWFQHTGAIPSGFDVEAAASDLSTLFKTPVLDLIAAETHFLGCDLWVNNGSYTASGQATDDTTGSGVGDALPTEDAIVVRLQTGAGGPSGRGRIFLSGIAENNVVLSRLTPACVTSAQALVAAMLAPTFGGTAWYLSHWNRKAGNLAGVIYGQAAPVMGHQRRRRPRR